VIRYPEASHEKSVKLLKLALIGPESVATIVESNKSLLHQPQTFHSPSDQNVPNAAKNVLNHMLPIVTTSLLVLSSSATGT
jgi:hypothetical protein